MERAISHALLLSLLITFPQLSASCNFFAVATKCVHHIRNLSSSVDNVLDLAPAIAEGPQLEHNPYVQDIVGDYCRTLSSTVRCIAKVDNEGCSELRSMFEEKLHQFLDEMPNVAGIMKNNPDCKRVISNSD